MPVPSGKPTTGTSRVDRTHPVGQRMLAAFLLDHDAPPADSIRSTVGSFSAAGAAWIGEDLVLNGSQYANLLSSTDTRRIIGAGQSFTVAFGARLSPSSASYPCIVGATSLSAGQPGWGILQAPSGDGSKVYGEFSDGTNDITTYSSPGFNADGVYHHFAAVLDRVSLTLRTYVDGVQVASAAIGALGAITPTGGIAVANRGAEILPCRVRYVYLIDRAMTTSELRQLVAFPYGPFRRPRGPVSAATAVANAAATLAGIASATGALVAAPAPRTLPAALAVASTRYRRLVASTPNAAAVLAGSSSATGSLTATVTLPKTLPVVLTVAATRYRRLVANTPNAAATLAGIGTATGAIVASLTAPSNATATLAGIASATGSIVASLTAPSNATATLAGVASATGALVATAAAPANATATLAGIASATGSLVASLTAPSNATATLAGIASATGALVATATGPATATLAGVASATGTLVAGTVGPTLGAWDKPAPGTGVNTAHPLAPRTATGVLLGLLDGSAATVVDDFGHHTFAATGTAGGPTWKASPAFPGASIGPALDLQKSPNVSQFVWSGGPTGAGAGGFQTVMAIVKVRSTSVDGPRVLGTGQAGGLVVEPSFTTHGTLWGLNNGVAHFDTTLAVAVGDWVFVGISYKSGDHYDAFLRNYTTPATASVAGVAAAALSTSDGKVTIGSSSASLPASASDALLYWGMVDNGPWSVADMTAVAATPFAMFGPPTAVLAGVASAAGSIVAITRIPTVLAGSIAVAGSLVATATAPNSGAALAATVTPVGTLVAATVLPLTSATLAGTIAPVGQLVTTSLSTATLAGTIAPVGTLVAQAYAQTFVTLAGSIGTAGSVAATTIQPNAGSAFLGSIGTTGSVVAAAVAPPGAAVLAGTARANAVLVAATIGPMTTVSVAGLAAVAGSLVAVAAAPPAAAPTLAGVVVATGAITATTVKPDAAATLAGSARAFGLLGAGTGYPLEFAMLDALESYEALP